MGSKVEDVMNISYFSIIDVFRKSPIYGIPCVPKYDSATMNSQLSKKEREKVRFRKKNRIGQTSRKEQKGTYLPKPSLIVLTRTQ